MKHPCELRGPRTLGFGSSSFPGDYLATHLDSPETHPGSRGTMTTAEAVAPFDPTRVGREDPGRWPPGRGRRVGRYLLVEPLGSGGQAGVWRAVRDGTPPQEVALKLLANSASGNNRRGVARLRHEAQRGARLINPSILAVSDFGVADGVAYLAMPLVEGGSLAHALDQRRRRRSPARPTRADDLWLATVPEAGYIPAVAGVVMRVAQALQAAHEANVVHCDVKPANILLDRHRPEWVYLADFGMGRDLDAVPPGRQWDLSGTPMYMAPERMLGQSADEMLCDVYSLGVTLFVAVTGVNPFRTPKTPCHPYVMMKHLAGQEPLRPRAVAPRVSRHIEAIIETAMARDPSRRYPRVSAMTDDLERFLVGRRSG